MVHFSAEIPPVPLCPTFNEDKCHGAWVKNAWETNDIAKDAKCQLPVCGSHDIENLCYVIREFKEHMPAARLHLTQGTERFGKFCKVFFFYGRQMDRRSSWTPLRLKKMPDVEHERCEIYPQIMVLTTHSIALE